MSSALHFLQTSYMINHRPHLNKPLSLLHVSIPRSPKRWKLIKKIWKRRRLMREQTSVFFTEGPISLSDLAAQRVLVHWESMFLLLMCQFNSWPRASAAHRNKDSHINSAVNLPRMLFFFSRVSNVALRMSVSLSTTLVQTGRSQHLSDGLQWKV